MMRRKRTRLRGSASPLYRRNLRKRKNKKDKKNNCSSSSRKFRNLKNNKLLLQARRLTRKPKQKSKSAKMKSMHLLNLRWLRSPKRRRIDSSDYLANLRRKKKTMRLGWAKACRFSRIHYWAPTLDLMAFQWLLETLCPFQVVESRDQQQRARDLGPWHNPKFFIVHL